MATIQEIQRLSCVAPASLIHSTTSDVEVEGYKLRKGQPLLANLTKFMHDANVFEDPKLFKPDRFIENNGDRVLKVISRYILRLKMYVINNVKTSYDIFVILHFFTISRISTSLFLLVLEREYALENH